MSYFVAWVNGKIRQDLVSNLINPKLQICEQMNEILRLIMSLVYLLDTNIENESTPLTVSYIIVIMGRF